MPYCKQGCCLNETDDGYCEKHGGKQRQEQEWTAEAAKAEARAAVQGQKPKGQAVPEGQGLSRFTDPAVLAERRRRKQAKRAKKEAERKTARLARGPKKKRKK